MQIVADFCLWELGLSMIQKMSSALKRLIAQRRRLNQC